MAKMKPLPKALIIAGAIGAIGVGVFYSGLLKKGPAPVEQVSNTPVGAAPVEAPQVVAQAPAPVQSPGLVPVPITAPAPAAAPLEAVPEGKLPGAGIASGQKTGTNYPMVEDIVKVCSTPEYPLRNVISNGTLDNINLVYSNPNAQFGIAQIDGLVAQKKIDKNMMSRIVAVFPFFSVEIHAIAANGAPINSLADLAGKRVVEGPEGSGTNITVQQIKALTGIQWQTVPGNLSQADGLKAVLNGAADVEFIVAGQPITLLRGATGIKLVPISHPKLDSAGFYTRASLPVGTYPWLSTSTNTYKVDNALVTFSYKNQYQTEIGNLVSCITRNMDNLQQHGHPKWKDVDPLDIDRIKWPAHPAAVAAIKREAKHR